MENEFSKIAAAAKNEKPGEWRKDKEFVDFIKTFLPPKEARKILYPPPTKLEKKRAKVFRLLAQEEYDEY